MKKQLCRSVLVSLIGVTIAIASYAAAPSTDAELARRQEELRRLEIEVEKMRRAFPPAFDEATEVGFFQGIAKSLELALEVKVIPGREGVPFEDGRLSPVQLYRLEISGRDRFVKLGDFLERLKNRARPVQLETLRYENERNETGSFTARFAIPCYTGTVEPVPAHLDHPRRIVESYRARIDQAKAILTVMIEQFARGKTGRLADTLAVFDAINRKLLIPQASDRSVLVTRLQIDSRVLIEGVVLGEAARANLIDGLEKPDFHVSDLQVSPAGACRAFSLTARRGVRESPLKIVFDKALLDGKAGAICRVEAEPSAGKIVVRGKASTGDKSAIFVRLRSVDVADVFSVINEVTGESFVVDNDVKGQVDVEIERATVKEVLAAMSAAGVAIGPGPLHRVSPASRRIVTASPSSTFTGAPLSLLLHGADLREVFCLFEQMAGLAMRVLPDLEGKATVFSTNLPWDMVLVGLFASADLAYTIQGEKLFAASPAAVEAFVKAGPGAAVPGASACERPKSVLEESPISKLPRFTSTTSGFSTASSSSRTVFDNERLSVPQLGVADVELAGVARIGDSWKAYAYGPWRKIMRIETSQELFDARVKSISSTGVVFATSASGVVGVSLRP
ncbi:MAG: hypothetical protein JJE51_10495 [Thermoanaerobaculia bacterium]|nr:hypothetical protein [Thermoanaerobaculia bacterium]